MLDIFSFAFGCGIQNEMDQVRKNTSENVLTSEQEKVPAPTTLSRVAESMDSVFTSAANSVSNAISGVVAAVAPAETPVAPVAKK